MTLSLFDSYRQGLARLIEKLGSDRSQLSAVYVYQQRLSENLDRATRYGDTETLRSERAEILDRLNTLTHTAFSLAFTDLCPTPASSNDAPPTVGDKPAYHINSGGGAVVLGDVNIAHGDFVGRDSIRSESPTRQSMPMRTGDQPVDTATLRIRLQRVDDVALDTLCMDHFPAVYDQFGRGQRRDEKINQLLAYVRTRPAEAARLATLLAQ